MATQKLYISTLWARQAVGNKAELDCLAFCVMCKLMFGASIIKKTTARQYKFMFRMGTERFRRIMGDCVRRGYIVDEGARYRIGKIKEARVQNMVVELPLSWGKSSDKRTAATLNEIKDYIRKVVAYDNFDKKDSIENALKSQANPKNLASYRKAKKLCSCISNNSVLSGRLRGTSMARIASTMQTCKTKARKLVRQMVVDGWMSITPITIKTRLRIEQFSDYALSLMKKMGWHGSYFRLGHDIFCRVANIYTLTGDSKLRYLRTV